MLALKEPQSKIEMYGSNSKQVIGLCKKVTDLLPVGEFNNTYKDLRSAFICMTPRSGSTYLGSLFQLNEQAHVQEHFRIVQGALENKIETYKIKNYDEYIKSTIKRCEKDNFFGVKIDWPQFIPVYYLGAYRHFFTNAKFIYLTRQNLVSQAVSRYLATESGFFHSTNTSLNQPPEIPFSYEKIEEHLQYLIQMMAAWEQFFAYEGIKPLRIDYENLHSNTVNVLEEIFEYCELPLSKKIEIKSKVEKTGTGLNSEYTECFTKRSRELNEKAEIELAYKESPSVS